jgi:hypothetical protein
MKYRFTSALLVTALVLSGSSGVMAGPKEYNDPYYGYTEQDHHQGDHSTSNTEKAVAAAVVGAIAIAALSAHNNNKKKKEQAYQQAPVRTDYREQHQTVAVRIRDVNGRVVPVYLNQTQNGYIGPQGEFYSSLPSAAQLGQTYGGWQNRPVGGGYNNGYAKPSQPQGSGGGMTAVVGQGKVTVMQGGLVVSTLRTAAPNVESQRFIAGQQQLVVKSRGNHGAANVELFDVRTGVLRDKILAYAIKGGKPAWARGMEE